MKRIVALILAVMLCASLAAPAMAANKNFSDVPSSHWAYNDIQSAADKGIISGYADGTFKPAGTVTNAQFFVMIARAFYPDELDRWMSTSEARGGEAWYMPALYTAVNAKLLDNTSMANTYVEDWDPDFSGAPAVKNINRYDMAQVMYNVMSDKGFSVSSSERSSAQASISDWRSIPSQYQTGVASCYALGLLGGYSDGQYKGTQTMNRAQAATVICRLYKVLSGESASVTPTQPAETTKPTNTDTPAAPSTAPSEETTAPDNTSSGAPSQPAQTTPTTEEFCAEVIRLVNVERANEGLAPLSTFDSLTEAAEIRAAELPELFSHTRPDGSTCFTALDETGASKGAYNWGENVAAGQSTPAAVVESWMNSPGHRANILGNYTHIGVGYVCVDSGYRHYWVQMFVAK